MVQLLSECTFVVVDVETTGFSPRTSAITEIAMIKVKEGKLIDEFASLVNPEMPIPYSITELTGIDDEMVYGAPTVQEIAPSISEFLSDGIFTAHNASFDLGFVNETLRRGNISVMDNRVVCTCKLARKLLPHLQSKSLEPVAKALGIRTKNLHRASADAFITAHVLIHFMNHLQSKFAVQTLEELMKFQ